MTIPNLSQLCYWSVVSLVESSRCFGCTEMSNDSCPYKCYERFEPSKNYGLRRYVNSRESSSGEKLVETTRPDETLNRGIRIEGRQVIQTNETPNEVDQLNCCDGEYKSPIPTAIKEEDKGLYSGIGEYYG